MPAADVSRVALARCPSYDPNALQESLGTLLGHLGGLPAFVKPKERVAVKVNILYGARPARAATTHPEVLAAVLSRVVKAGGEPFVCESPFGHTTPALMRLALSTSGIGAVCERFGVPFALLDESTVDVDVPDARLFAKLKLGRAIVEADAIISLPKLKTHSFQRLTCAVKLLFGAVPGLEKSRFHVKVPDRLDFAHMLLDLLTALRPRLAIVDAVVAMEGEGPSGGNPRHVGALMAGADHVAVDVIAARLIGMDPASVWTTKAALDRGLLTDPAAIEVVGDGLEDLEVGDFKHPLPDAADSLPGTLVQRVMGLTTARPYLAHPQRCTGCAACATGCPVRAIVIDSDLPRFDDDTCIRCYCCSEICPESALGRRNSWPSRLLFGG